MMAAHLLSRIAEPPNLDPDPPSTLFRRHLPQPLSDASVNQATRWGDYKHLATRLDMLVNQYREHLRFHSMEAQAIVGLAADGRGVLPYIADLGHAITVMEALLDPQGSAVKHRGALTARVLR
jgi:hypothetical protein